MRADGGGGGACRLLAREQGVDFRLGVVEHDRRGRLPLQRPRARFDADGALQQHVFIADVDFQPRLRDARREGVGKALRVGVHGEGHDLTADRPRRLRERGGVDVAYGADGEREGLVRGVVVPRKREDHGGVCGEIEAVGSTVVSNDRHGFCLLISG